MTDMVAALATTGPAVGVEAAAKSASRNPPSAIDKAAHDMEGYFVGMLLKQMHESAAKGGVFDSGSESTTYREMFDEAVAGEIGKRGSFGIADTLIREFMGRENPAAEGAKDGGK